MLQRSYNARNIVHYNLLRSEIWFVWHVRDLSTGGQLDMQVLSGPFGGVCPVRGEVVHPEGYGVAVPQEIVSSPVGIAWSQGQRLAVPSRCCSLVLLATGKIPRSTEE